MLLHTRLSIRRLGVYPYVFCCRQLSNRNIQGVMEYVSGLIKFEDNHIMVVSKPPNLLVHSDHSNDRNLSDLIKAYIKQKYNKPGDVYLGVVHRIDLPCSGLLLFAKTSKAAARLTSSFVTHDISKKYVAIVQGEMLGSGELHHLLQTDTPVVKSVYGRKTNDSSSTKEAKLKYQSLGTLLSSGPTSKTSVVDVELHTGRKHQIRAQLAHIGHPIVNDVKYGYVTTPASGASRVSAIYLHSYLLSFTHPISKQRVTFQDEVPSCWVGGDYSIRVIEALNKKLSLLVQEHKSAAAIQYRSKEEEQKNRTESQTDASVA